MTNAEQFKKTFGIYTEEFWSYTEKQMLDWINTDVPDINIGDMISRQEAIDLMALAIEDDWEVGYATDRMNELPSAQPEPQWIPCSERLPEEYGEYICTMENGQVQECGFVPENQRGLADGWSTCEADGYKFLGYVDVLAWMPLPEPYRERREE